MFEKEAEKYAENNAYKYASDYISCQEAYKDGAEFGYNKTKEIIKELIDDWMTMEGDEIRELKSVKEAEELLQSLSKQE